MEWFEADPDRATQEYRRRLALPKGDPGKIGDGPNVFGTDDTKLLNPVYAANLENRARTTWRCIRPLMLSRKRLSLTISIRLS